MAVFYKTLMLHNDKKCRNLMSGGVRDETVLHEAYKDGKRVLEISREGDTVTISNPSKGVSIELPWANVRHAVVDLSRTAEGAPRKAATK